MTKKLLLEKILVTIAPDRPAANGFLLLLKQWVLNNEKIGEVIEIFKSRIDQEEDKKKKLKLSTTLSFLEKMQSLEEKSKKADEEELKELEAMLSIL